MLLHVLVEANRPAVDVIGCCGEAMRLSKNATEEERRAAPRATAKAVVWPVVAVR